ncbi:protein kinase (macronuclear) [Tetrahymena thermophila SB210]|uniref:non-specific serine/threonine protein kinase n=1 Tax=Tetrahymena thermophila (strain SB210) TaxID=312017 RepID=A4VD77_TETTS|nr:protein kinase [Tetrahymena thermophila SB210]EDK31479.2 protein kinase [Tetrahymena thermophila SB210]|eukprot:XP_001470943.2 protein kinase [Tetrahymena thermophila SB210]
MISGEDENQIIQVGQQRIKIYLKKLIGAGAYGKVYLSDYYENESSSPKISATKILDNNQKDLIDITREIQIITQIEGENIVEAYLAFKNTSQVYIVSEYCEQGTLDDYCKKNNLSILDIMQLFKKILEGYKLLKANNVIHRDIKHENILMKNGIPKIADFGLAKVTRDNTIQNEHTLNKGTPVYSSPQVFQEISYSYKADIYSLGVVLYKMIYKKYPNKISSYMQLLKFIKQLQKMPIQSVINFDDSPVVIQEIKDLIYKMMAYQECDRITLEDLIPSVQKVIDILQKENILQKNRFEQNQQAVFGVTPQPPEDDNSSYENPPNRANTNYNMEQFNKNLQLPNTKKIPQQQNMNIQGYAHNNHNQQQVQLNPQPNNNCIPKQEDLQRNSISSHYQKGQQNYLQDCNLIPQQISNQYNSIANFQQQAQQNNFTNNNDKFPQQNFDSAQRQSNENFLIQNQQSAQNVIGIQPNENKLKKRFNTLQGDDIFGQTPKYSQDFNHIPQQFQNQKNPIVNCQQQQTQQNYFTNNNDKFPQQNFDSAQRQSNENFLMQNQQNYSSNNNNQFPQQKAIDLKGGQPIYFQQNYYSNNINNAQQYENNNIINQNENYQQQQNLSNNRRSLFIPKQLINADEKKNIQLNNQNYQYQQQQQQQQINQIPNTNRAKTLQGMDKNELIQIQKEMNNLSINQPNQNQTHQQTAQNIQQYPIQNINQDINGQRKEIKQNEKYLQLQLPKNYQIQEQNLNNLTTKNQQTQPIQPMQVQQNSGQQIQNIQQQPFIVQQQTQYQQNIQPQLQPSQLFNNINQQQSITEQQNKFHFQQFPQYKSKTAQFQ